ncbi:MAG: hypothetical protein L6408_03305, partial [Nanoarchaeota archaeon]|nr:hypothetical protein [Nanoarchaeota archaeon]
KYNKKLVYMDNSSVGGHLLQGLATISGLSMGASGFSLIGQNIKDGELTRRKLISSGLIATIGTYIFMGGSIFAEPIKSLMYDNYIEQSKYEKIYTTHVTDHRDLTLANRLIKLTEILDKKEFETGKHVSFIFGGQHAIGAAYYLDHPVFRKIKSAVYRCTYDFVDNDKMTIYTPTPYKTWKRKDYIL